jgi:tetratricopeptide (TPR) repeat protein
VAWRLESAGFAAGAAEAWRAALEADPGLPQAHLGLGRALLSLRDPAGAASAARRALDAHAAAAARGAEGLLEDPDEDPWYVLGQAEHLRGDLAAAVEAYGRSAGRFPWFAEPLFEAARAEMARGDAAAAADAARRALRRARWRPGFAREIEALLGSIPGA